MPDWVCGHFSGRQTKADQTTAHCRRAMSLIVPQNVVPQESQRPWQTVPLPTAEEQVSIEQRCRKEAADAGLVLATDPKIKSGYKYVMFGESKSSPWRATTQHKVGEKWERSHHGSYATAVEASLAAAKAMAGTFPSRRPAFLISTHPLPYTYPTPFQHPARRAPGREANVRLDARAASSTASRSRCVPPAPTRRAASRAAS